MWLLLITPTLERFGMARIGCFSTVFSLDRWCACRSRRLARICWITMEDEPPSLSICTHLRSPTGLIHFRSLTGIRLDRVELLHHPFVLRWKLELGFEMHPRGFGCRPYRNMPPRRSRHSIFPTSWPTSSRRSRHKAKSCQLRGVATTPRLGNWSSRLASYFLIHCPPPRFTSTDSSRPPPQSSAVPAAPGSPPSGHAGRDACRSASSD